MGGSGAENSVDCGGLTQKVSNRYNMSNWVIDLFVIFWLYNLAPFHPCCKNKLKSFGLMSLAEKISRQSSIASVMWLLVMILMQIYNEKRQG